MEVRKDERQENNIFSCGCGNCDAKVCEIKRGNLSVKEFFCEYGLNIFKIFISAILLLIGVIIPLDSVVKVIIYSVAAFICGYELIVKCFKHLIKKEWFDENTLMLIAVITAFCIGECVEGVLVVILYSVGELFEEIATDNSRRKIAGLSKLKSSVVRVMTKDGLVEMSPEQVKIGSFVEVRQGDRVPIDGILIDLGTILFPVLFLTVQRHAVCILLVHRPGNCCGRSRSFTNQSLRSFGFDDNCCFCITISLFAVRTSIVLAVVLIDLTLGWNKD